MEEGSQKVAHLLPQQLVVHLHPLHLLVALLQTLVVLPQLPDVVAGLGQDASFTLPTTKEASLPVHES